MKYAVLILAMVLVAIWKCRGCRHDVRMPIHGDQICVQCGVRREYRIGEKPGPWRKE